MGAIAVNVAVSSLAGLSQDASQTQTIGMHGNMSFEYVFAVDVDVVWVAVAVEAATTGRNNMHAGLSDLDVSLKLYKRSFGRQFAHRQKHDKDMRSPRVTKEHSTYPTYPTYPILSYPILSYHIR